MLQKRHFQQFADLIREHLRVHNWELQADDTARREAAFAARVVATVASCSNPRFDRSRFMRACGLED